MKLLNCNNSRSIRLLRARTVSVEHLLVLEAHEQVVVSVIQKREVNDIGVRGLRLGCESDKAVAQGNPWLGLDGAE